MKYQSRLLAMLMLGAVAAGFTACSDDDSDAAGGGVTDSTVYPSAAPTSLADVVSVYVDDVIYPTYSSLAANAATLANACSELYQSAAAGTMTQAQIDAACQAFSDARVEWERSEAWLYGAASDYNIDPHIDSWPLDQGQMEDVLTNQRMLSSLRGENGVNPVLYVRQQNATFDTALGFHGLEFVLFRDGRNRTVAELSTYDTMKGMTTVQGVDELAFLAAVAGDVRDKCYQLEYCWLGSQAPQSHSSWLATQCTDISETELASSKGNSYGDNLKATGSSLGDYGSWQMCASNIIDGGCSNICQEVYTQKLGQAYRVATGQGGAEDAIDYIESPYSKRSYRDYRDNIYSIKNALYGTTDIAANGPVRNSLLNYMHKYGYERTANLSAALDNAIATLTSAMESGIAFVDNPGHHQVQQCISAVQELDDELQQARYWIERY